MVSEIGWRGTFAFEEVAPRQFAFFFRAREPRSRQSIDTTPDDEPVVLTVSIDIAEIIADVAPKMVAGLHREREKAAAHLAPFTVRECSVVFSGHAHEHNDRKQFHLCWALAASLIKT